VRLAFSCELFLPDWVEAFVAEWPETWADDASVMRAAVALAAESVRRGAGGPFAALVVDSDDGRLVAAGINRVTAAGLSVAHAEIMALSLAQARLGHWNLAQAGSLALFTTCEPCAMCYGAIPWSGVQRLVCGARKDDAEVAGFDEGEKPPEWCAALERRGIEVIRDCLRTEAADLFGLYARLGGEIYNPCAHQEGGA